MDGISQQKKEDGPIRWPLPKLHKDDNLAALVEERAGVVVQSAATSSIAGLYRITFTLGDDTKHTIAGRLTAGGREEHMDELVGRVRKEAALAASIGRYIIERRRQP